MQGKPNPISRRAEFDKLPDDVKKAMTSVDSAKVLQEISKEHGLHIDQAGALSDETGKLMLGSTDPSQFVGNIKKRVGVNSDTARKIAEKINNEIFKPVRESLKKIHEIGGTINSEDEDTSANKQVKEKDPYREPVEDDDIM